MVDINMLRAKVEDKGISYTALARKAGISRETLYNRFSNPDNFKVSEVQGISEALNLGPSEFRQIFLQD